MFKETEKDANKITFKDFTKTVNSTIIKGGHFYTVKGGNNLYRRCNKSGVRDEMIKTVFLHPHGKGTYNAYPFFIYKEGVFRKDIPKEVLQGTPYNKIQYNTYNDLYKANLTTHILQDGDTSDGGIILYDFGESVEVKMKNGKLRLFEKKYLNFEKIYYQKSKGKGNKCWFKYVKGVETNGKKQLTIDGDKVRYGKAPIKIKNPYKEYIKIKNSIDPNSDRSDGLGSWKVNKQKREEMIKLYDLMSDSDKLKLNKLKN